MKNRLNVRHTVNPNAKLTYEQWCRKYNVSSQWYDRPQDNNLMHDYRWDAVIEQESPFITKLVNHLIKIVKTWL